MFQWRPVTEYYNLDVTTQTIVAEWSFTTPYGVISSTMAGANAGVAQRTLANGIDYEAYFEIITANPAFDEALALDFAAPNRDEVGTIYSPGGDVYGSPICQNIPGLGYPACEPDVFLAGSTKNKSSAQTEAVVWDFKGGSNGYDPQAGLVADSNGALYGVTRYGGGGDCSYLGATGCGTVFMLTPPSQGRTAWTYKMLYKFKGGVTDGSAPYASLVFGETGVLYGTTSSGGINGAGTVFELIPPGIGGATWTEKVLYNFKGGTSDGSLPYAGLIFDSSGNLYGTTVSGGTGGQGTVFQLSPPAAGMTAWAETLLYSFKGGTRDGAQPYAGLVIDSSGLVLYGTTLGGGAGLDGTVFQLKPPGADKTAWTERVLHSFRGGSSGDERPYAGLLVDADGALYGTAFGGSNSTSCIPSKRQAAARCSS